MRTQYYNFYEKGYNNVYTTIKVCTLNELNSLQNFYDKLSHPSNFDRVTVKELRQLAKEEKDRIKYDNAFSDYCNPLKPISVAEFLMEYNEVV